MGVAVSRPSRSGGGTTAVTWLWHSALLGRGHLVFPSLPSGTDSHPQRQDQPGSGLRRHESGARANPKRLLSLWQGRWGIENRLHWVRDVTFDEDRCQVRTGAAPQIMAAMRNLTISLLRLAAHLNIAAALRHHAAHPAHALAILGVTQG